MQRDIAVEVVRDMLDYEPDTGYLIWRKRIGPRALAGSRAGFVMDRYRKIRLKGCDYFEHRIIWLHVHGKWPDNCIDHVNRDCFDNRLANLREATVSLNQANKKMPNTNRSGFKGVYYLKNRNRFVAQVRRKKIGMFRTAEAAHAAYCRAAQEEFGQFARFV